MKNKDAGLRIRVERDLRDEFLEACRAQDRPAAQVLREFMRDYVARHPPDGSETAAKGAESTTRKPGRGSTAQ